MEKSKIKNFRLDNDYRYIPKNFKFIKKKNNNYKLWEYTYFSHNLNIFNIFVNNIKLPNIDMFSFDFLEIFLDFIYECSTGNISKNIEEMNKQSKDVYLNYIRE